MAVLILLATATMSFNLVCSGHEVRTGILNPLLPANERVEPKTTLFSEIYRIDLKQKRWCRGGCEATQSPVSVTRSDIIIEDERSGTMRFSTVSRETGKYSSKWYAEKGIELFQYGSCRKSPFAGFPKQKF